MTDMGRVHNVPDIWLSSLVAALEAMARAPEPPPEIVAAFRQHLAAVPPVLCAAPETVPEPQSAAPATPCAPVPRPFETTH